MPDRAISKRARLAAAVLAAAAGFAGGGGTQAAQAHGEYTPTIVTLLDGVKPSVPGLRARVIRDQAAQLDVVNDTGRELSVLAESGDPFLKIGPRGVFANVNSATWYRSGNPDGVSNPPKDARIGGPPRFVRVSRKHSWRWFDHRMHPGTVRVGKSTLRDQSRARLDDWTVAARLGTQGLKFAGHVEYRPLRGNIASSLTGPAAPAPGVSVQFLPGRLPGLFLTNTGTTPVTVTGKDGEPFARISRRGVEVNLRSRTYVEDQSAKGERVVPPTIAGPAVQWRKVSSQGQLAWLDTRTRYPRQQPPDAVVNGSSKRLLDRWSIPLEVGARRVELRGKTTWVPLPEIADKAPKQIGGSKWLELGGAGLGLVLIGAVALRLRAARRSGRELERV